MGNIAFNQLNRMDTLTYLLVPAAPDSEDENNRLIATTASARANATAVMSLRWLPSRTPS